MERGGTSEKFVEAAFRGVRGTKKWKKERQLIALTFQDVKIQKKKYTEGCRGNKRKKCKKWEIQKDAEAVRGSGIKRKKRKKVYIIVYLRYI